MLQVVLPDGGSKDFDRAVTVREVAEAIGARLAKAAVAGAVDGKTVGLDYRLPVEGQVQVKIFTAKDPEALGVMRHSAAHVMARAVMRLRKGVQLAFGPTIDGGFYYDVQADPPLSEEDFPAIEAEMKSIIAADEAFERIETPRAEALQIVQGLEQKYKVEHIETGLKDHPELSFYRQGEFIDLCRGPHIPSPKAIGAYKLLSIAGAYWKGDSNNAQLQRLYATAFFTKEELEAHLAKIEEAKRRDHRLLGKQLELFTINQDKVGPGLILWLPKGATIRGLLEGFIREELLKRGYQAVYTPNIGKIDLYKTSGHFPYYSESMFSPFFEQEYLELVENTLDSIAKFPASKEMFLEAFALQAKENGLEKEVPGWARARTADERVSVLTKFLEAQDKYILKPMNCPHHIMIYNNRPRSYRELPLRLAEFGTVYRYEKSGQLNGMTRVRGFCQDDAHIFCTPDQVENEFTNCIEMTQFVLKTLGLNNYRVRLGFRDPASDKYVGSPEVWQNAQNSLVHVCKNLGIDYTAEEGEAAFYGPKSDFVITDCIGREWQLGTVQLDYNLPSAGRFNLDYVGADNHPHKPVMIHRAPLGSLERFIGVLIEHFAGAFPLWLAPEQVRVLTVSEKSEEYGRKVEQELRAKGFRVSGDFRSEKLGAKVRDAQLELIPYMLVVGPRDAEQGTVSVRDRIEGDVGAMPLGAAIERLQAEVAEKRVRKTFSGNAGLAEKAGANEY